ncbi:MAG: DUF5009 domain-containing protein [candidate division WOR-3 bacterium]
MPSFTAADRTCRNQAIDAFRGTLLALMIIFNYINQFTGLPRFLCHAPPLCGITLPDLGFPMFLFILGLVIPGTLCRRRKTCSSPRLVLRFLRRYLLFTLFGIAGNLLLRQPLFTHWSVLQSIGTAGIISLPFIFLKPALRLLGAFLLLIIFRLITLAGYGQWLLANETGGLGGILGGIAWAGAILFGTFIGEKPDDNRRTLTAAATLILAGILAGLIIPFSKPLITPSYLLFTTGIGALGFLLFSLLDCHLHIRPGPLIILGVNPLFVFMLSGVLSTLAAGILPSPSPIGLVLITATILLLTWLPALLLYRKNWLIRL